MAKEENKKNILQKILVNKYTLSILAMGVISIVIIAGVLYGLSVYTKHGESVTVPSVIGMQVEEAAKALEKASLRYEVVDSIFLTNGTPGAITEQVPEENASVKKNRTVFLTMQAKSVEMITIPLLKDYSSRQAVTTLNSLGFSKITITEEPSPYKGIVLDVTYKGRPLEANEKLPKGDPIGLIIGSGEELPADSLDYDIIKNVGDESPVDNSFFE